MWLSYYNLHQDGATEKDLMTPHTLFVSDDGIARIVVHGTGPESSQVNADGLRSSSRTRTESSTLFSNCTGNSDLVEYNKLVAPLKTSAPPPLFFFSLLCKHIPCLWVCVWV